jgi:hypothetical protein
MSANAQLAADYYAIHGAETKQAVVYSDGVILYLMASSRREKRWIKHLLVSYLPRPETRTALESFAQSDVERLLLTSSGSSWVLNRKDPVASLWQNQQINTPIKRLRQASGDYLEKQFGRPLPDHSLGHGGGSVDRAYFSRQQNELDEAILWLRHYFITEVFNARG